MRFHRYLMLVLALTLGSSMAQLVMAQPGSSPVYARQRAGARGGGAWNRGYRLPVRPPFDQGGFGSHGYYGYGFQPAIAGNWYARPYPYHFDYYRMRYSSPQPIQAVEFPVTESQPVQD